MAATISRSEDSTRKWLHILAWTISTAGFGALVAAQFDGISAVIGVGTLIGMASATAGASLGFLFAVPRVLSASSSDDGEPAKNGEARRTDPACSARTRTWSKSRTG